MADWRKVALAAFLADGVIDDTEVKILRKELFGDRKSDDEERDFLIELRNAAQKKAYRGTLRPAFEKLAMPNTVESRARASSQLADGPSTISMRPIRTRTAVTSRPLTAARMLRARRATNHGRFRPLSAIS